MGLVIEHGDKPEEVVPAADADQGVAAVIAVGIDAQRSVQHHRDVLGGLFPGDDAVVFIVFHDLAGVGLNECADLLVGSVIEETAFSYLRDDILHIFHPFK